jgi:thioredoxin reductase (NADPH)
MPPTRIHYRVAIIGSGPAGWTAALYSARADLQPIVIQGSQPGGQLMITTDVENYPGFPGGIQGPEMMDLFRAQAERFGTEVLLDLVTDVDFEARPFRLTLDSGANLTADAIIIASGASAKALGIRSERQPASPRARSATARSRSTGTRSSWSSAAATPRWRRPPS